MPRARRQRRLENRQRRRHARRSLNLLLLDDDFVSPEPEDWGDLPRTETVADPLGYERFLFLSPHRPDRDE
jgi:hypothetical protein